MKFASVTLFFSLLLGMASCYKGSSADVIIHNAKIHTMDDQGATYEAVAIKDGKILELGPERKILNKYSADEVIDAEMKDVYPGFTDAHAHIFSYARKKLGVDLVGCRSFEEMIVRIEKYHSKHDRPYIIGHGWDQSLWGENTMPINDTLNLLFPGIPVCLFRIDGHTLLANDYLIAQSDALAKYKADPELLTGGYYEQHPKVLRMECKGPCDVPSGVFVDNAMNPILDILPDFSDEELSGAILEIQQELLSYGITGVHEAGVKYREMRLFERLMEKGKFHLNLYAMLLPTPKNKAFAEKNGVYKKHSLLVRSFTVHGDGSLGSRGAFLKRHYSDRNNHSGYFCTSPERMQSIADFCEGIGYQMNTNATGDSTTRLLLDIYSGVAKRNPDHRWRIEHVQVIDVQDIMAFANVRALPGVQPTHAVSHQHWAESRLGPDRMPGAYAYRSLLEACGLLAIGTDFPVEYTDPFRTIHAAVNRQNAENHPGSGFLAQEAIAFDECIRGMTIWAAVAAFQEDTLGSLEEDKDATLVIFDGPVTASGPYKPNFAHTVFIRGEKVYSVE